MTHLRMLEKEYCIADEEGCIYKVSSELLKEAQKFGAKGSNEHLDFLGKKLDDWKELPLLTRGKTFIKRGHVLTRKGN